MPSDETNQLSSRDAYFLHLQAWALDHGQKTKFRGYISPSGKKPTYKLGQPVRCLVRPLDIHETFDVLVKLTQRKDAKNRMKKYSMSISDFGAEWMSEEDWFGRLASAQQEREARGARVASKPEPDEPVQIWKRPRPGEQDVLVKGPQNRTNRAWVVIRPPFPFLRLPTELRLQVLDCILYAREIWPRFGTVKNKKSTLQLERHPNNIPELVPTLLLNHELRDQVAHHVYSNVIFNFSSVKTLLWFLQQIRLEDRRSIRSLALHLSEESYSNLFAGITDSYGPVEEIGMESYARARSLLKGLNLKTLIIYQELYRKRRLNPFFDGRPSSDNFSEDDTSDSDDEDPDYNEDPDPDGQMPWSEPIKSTMSHVPKIDFVMKWMGFTLEDIKKLGQPWIQLLQVPEKMLKCDELRQK